MSLLCFATAHHVKRISVPLRNAFPRSRPQDQEAEDDLSICQESAKRKDEICERYNIGGATVRRSLISGRPTRLAFLPPCTPGTLRAPYPLLRSALYTYTVYTMYLLRQMHPAYASPVSVYPRLSRFTGWRLSHLLVLCAIISTSGIRMNADDAARRKYILYPVGEERGTEDVTCTSVHPPKKEDHLGFSLPVPHLTRTGLDVAVPAQLGAGVVGAGYETRQLFFALEIYLYLHTNTAFLPKPFIFAVHSSSTSPRIPSPISSLNLTLHLTSHLPLIAETRSLFAATGCRAGGGQGGGTGYDHKYRIAFAVDGPELSYMYSAPVPLRPSPITSLRLNLPPLMGSGTSSEAALIFVEGNAQKDGRAG
ncbi:hypothetical protein R3P38DRAFT_2804108 [Favolaschia claudopus]|uniref:HTH psq-type domain-containing protein n=1 Tax=Favolaschia claudopus TaxID=2862362 RepID=A0AAV9ZQT9_9AGAR